MVETGQIPDSKTIADRLAIYDVLVLHCRGVDRGDAAILKSAYWPDAEVAYGAFNGSAHVFCERLPRAMHVFQWTHHAIGNVAIDVDGIDARIETYVVARHCIADAVEGGTRDVSDPLYAHLLG